MSVIQGRAWIFGHNVNTDLISSGRYLYSPIPEAALHAFETIHPEFAANVKPGDLIVAGRNFGCGSARDTAPRILKHVGIACVLAEDFARIFFRNAISVGLPVLAVEGISGKVRPLEEVSVSLETGEITILGTKEVLRCPPLHPQMLSILQAGGIGEILKNLKRS